MSTSIQPNAPFRADIVGSFLRPQAVKDARAAYVAGKLDASGLKAVEDEAIRDLVAKQKAAGLQVITDGEFRRSYWHLDFMWGLNGIERRTSRTGYMFHDEETTADTAVVTGPISGENHPFVEHFKFVKSLEGEGQIARQTIPAPIQTFSEVTLDRCDGQQESLRAVYKTDEELADAIAAAYRTVIADLYAAGCRNIQFDDCTWGIYCDTDFVSKTGMSPVDLQKLPSRASPTIWLSTRMCAAATITPRMPSRVVTIPLHRTCLRTRMSTRSTLSSIRRAPVALSRSSMSPPARRWCWDWSLQRRLSLRTRTLSSNVSKRPQSMCRSRTCTCRPSAALPAARLATN